MTYSKNISYNGNGKTIETKNFLPKKELSQIFGTGTIKLQISRTRKRLGKAHSKASRNHHSWIIRMRYKTKTKKIYLY